VLSVKILGGYLKGRKISVPPKGTRPTSVLLRRRLFDSMQTMNGRDFVDLCAGSGVMGFEALSRGADAVRFVDEGRSQCTYLKKNIQTLGIEGEKALVTRSCANTWIKKNREVFFENCVIFFDPPYNKKNLYFDFINEMPKDLRCEVVIELSVKTDFYKDITASLSEYRVRIISQGEKIFLRCT